MVYHIGCNDCKKTYFGDTKFTMEKKRRKQHNKNVEFGRTNKHIMEMGHIFRNGWEKWGQEVRMRGKECAVWKKKKVITQKNLESCHIKKNRMIVYHCTVWERKRGLTWLERDGEIKGKIGEVTRINFM